MFIFMIGISPIIEVIALISYLKTPINTHVFMSCSFSH
jgi:hypothetical protein